MDIDCLQRIYCWSKSVKEIPKDAEHLGDIPGFGFTIKIYNTTEGYVNCVVPD